MDYDIVNPRLELTDPNPDIWELFRQFDGQFFENFLTQNCVELSWSPRMTQTAGLCAWSPRTNFCSIKLSLPLLQLRSRRDLVETLIHEMIHALLFVTRQDDNHESHGEKFHYHMYRINQMTGCNITVYHTFHNEVRNYQQHVWKCDGPCQNWRPFFGLVRRSMNRKPSANDTWWKRHQESCGGIFHKISEPDQKSKPRALAQPSKSKLTGETSSSKKKITPPRSQPSSSQSILSYLIKPNSSSRLKAPSTSTKSDTKPIVIDLTADLSD